MTRTNRRNINDTYFVDRSYPSERITLEVDVFELELIVADYIERRAMREEFCDFCDDEWESYRAAEAELNCKRARLAALSQ